MSPSFKRPSFHGLRGRRYGPVNAVAVPAMRKDDTMNAEKKIEIAYLIPAGRDGRLTWKRKTVAASKCEAACAKLVEQGATEFRFAREEA